MELIYRYSESTVRPVEIEKSKRTVFLRRNIVEEERTDVFGDVRTFYVYEEAKLSHEEFDKYASVVVLQNLSNLASGQAVGDNNQLIIMEALADLYEAIAGKM